MNIKEYDIAKQNGNYGIIVKKENILYFKNLYWITGISYIGNVLENIQDDILKVEDESFIKFLLYNTRNLDIYLKHNEEFNYLVL